MEFTTILKGTELKSLKLKLTQLGASLVSQCSKNVAAVFALKGIVTIYYFNLFLFFYYKKVNIVTITVNFNVPYINKYKYFNTTTITITISNFSSYT